MAAAISTSIKLATAVSTAPAKPHRWLIIAQAKKGARGPMGYVNEDNSGKANIFAVEPKTLYTSSPTSDRAASQGLGGAQGAAVLAAAIALVALVTFGLAKNPDELTKAGSGTSVDSLSAIAAQLERS